jgi:hypothetical protein
LQKKKKKRNKFSAPGEFTPLERDRAKRCGFDPDIQFLIQPFLNILGD